MITSASGETRRNSEGLRLVRIIPYSGGRSMGKRSHPQSGYWVRDISVLRWLTPDRHFAGLRGYRRGVTLPDDGIRSVTWHTVCGADDEATNIRLT